MELNEIFQKVKNHLLNQNAKSGTLREDFKLDKFGANPPFNPISCMYKDPNGNKCAVGCLFVDDENTKYVWCENKSISDSNVQDELIRAGVLTQEDCHLGFHHGKFHLLHELQQIHDWEKVEDWPECLSNLAKSFGINTNGT